MTETTFSTLGVAEPLLRALTASGYQTPTPIQAQAIPALVEGRDLLGIAQTGTGKTAAFALPLLQRLAESQDRAPARGCRALILAPTRELAVQINESLGSYSRFLNLRRAVVLGGVGQRPQVKALARGVDILIATPGRLLDLFNQRHLRLDHTGILVLDEADRMLDMGFIHDVRKIVAALSRKRQSLLFSATMPAEVAKLAASILHKPLRVEVTPQKITVERIDQRVHFVETARKRELMTELLSDPSLSRCIVFTRTKHGADRLARQLDRTGIACEALHGNKTQSARQTALRRFRNGQARLLIATDIAARGIDVDGVTHVINFDLPHEPESYVHRIGRTARAGAEGIAVSLCSPEERDRLRAIEKLIRRPIDDANERPPMPRGDNGKRRGGNGKPRQGQAARRRNRGTANGNQRPQRRAA